MQLAPHIAALDEPDLRRKTLQELMDAVRSEGGVGVVRLDGAQEKAYSVVLSGGRLGSEHCHREAQTPGLLEDPEPR